MESKRGNDVEGGLDLNVIRIAEIKDDKIRKTMEGLDKEKDGDIDVMEVMRLKQLERWYRRSTYMLTLVAIVLMGLMFGVTYGAIEVSKESHVSTVVESSSTSTTRRRRLGPQAEDNSPSTFVDIDGKEMVMGKMKDVKIPIGDGSTVLAQLAEQLRRQMDPQRRRNRRVRRRRLTKSMPKTAGPNHGQHCETHAECDTGDFCYQGYCDFCAECHFCHDGKDGTCGTCAGGPTMEDSDCSDETDENGDDEWAEFQPPMGIEDAFKVECHVPEFATRYACAGLPPQADYMMDFAMDFSRRFMLANDDNTTVAWETSLCGMPAEMRFVLSEQGLADEIEFFYPSHHFGTGVRGMHCELAIHVDSIEALAMFRQMNKDRENEKLEYISQHGQRDGPHMITDYLYFEDLTLPDPSTSPTTMPTHSHPTSMPSFTHPDITEYDSCPSWCTNNIHWIGDQYCDEPCRGCDEYWHGDVFDRGDCDMPPTTQEPTTEAGCPDYCADNPHWVGDDYCDEPCRSCDMYWQGQVFDKNDCVGNADFFPSAQPSKAPSQAPSTMPSETPSN